MDYLLSEPSYMENPLSSQDFGRSFKKELPAA